MKIKRNNPQAARFLCIQKDHDVQRVHTADADRMVAEEGYHYVPRSVWKHQVRDKT